jgi:hypothetical protein
MEFFFIVGVSIGSNHVLEGDAVTDFRSVEKSFVLLTIVNETYLPSNFK